MTASDLVELAGREAIAPCPFCGGYAQAQDFKGTKFKPAVSCTVCPADMPARTMAEAITAWNRRVALRERIPLPADGGAREALDTYDAGLLNDWGGGNVEWWQDYIRAELGRAHDFYATQFDRLALHPSSRGEAEQK